MNRFTALLCALLITLSPPLSARDITTYDELALHLHNVAQRCLARAKSMPDGIAASDDLLLTARICTQGAHDLFAEETQDKEAVARHVAALLNGMRTDETLVRRNPTGEQREEDMCVHLPLNEIITLIEEEKLDLYLRPTPLQLTAKRMVLKLIVELFNGFGRRALTAQKLVKKHLKTEITAPVDEGGIGLQKMFMKKLVLHLITNRPEFLLRTLRIFANKYVDKMVPHPEQPQWHKPLEMLIPMALGHALSYIISYGKTPEIELPEDTGAQSKANKTKYNLGYEILSDGFLRFAYNRFYCKEESKYYKYINGLCWLLPFIFTDTNIRLWREANRDGDGNLRNDRFSFYAKNAQAALPDIITEGIVETAIWSIIDDVIMPKIEIPQWLLATPVQRSRRELGQSDNLEELLEESRHVADAEE
ncbi:MAG: hypothetical protein PVJ92_01160 [Candidatus Dependentiae bacterium]|jgi:hypothetical protein